MTIYPKSLAPSPITLLDTNLRVRELNGGEAKEDGMPVVPLLRPAPSRQYLPCCLYHLGKAYEIQNTKYPEIKLQAYDF